MLIRLHTFSSSCVIFNKNTIKYLTFTICPYCTTTSSRTIFKSTRFNSDQTININCTTITRCSRCHSGRGFPSNSFRLSKSITSLKSTINNLRVIFRRCRNCTCKTSSRTVYKFTIGNYIRALPISNYGSSVST